jgi:tetratricopeptide (TPR) repeat protein
MVGISLILGYHIANAETNGRTRPMRPFFLLVLTKLLFPSLALACLWDYDTLLQEQSRFPDVLELITGKFPRHSQEFYIWRIKDRVEKLKGNPDSLAYLDDLAVAFDKIGDQQKAIELMLAAEEKQRGRYETEANLGTFYIHAGQWEDGLVHISNALRINADAHFGREKYQQLLVEFMLFCRADGNLSLPLAQSEKAMKLYAGVGFHAFLEKQLGLTRLTPEGRQEAIKGILGIMRFGNHESPVVLEAMASLLSRDNGFDEPSVDAKQLAARAYLKASYMAPGAQSGYRQMAGDVLQMQKGTSLERLDRDFEREVADAKKWSEQVRQDELNWIQDGKNPEEEFARKYYVKTVVAPRTEYFREIIIGLLAGVPVFCVAYFFLMRYRTQSALRVANQVGDNSVPVDPT